MTKERLLRKKIQKDKLEMIKSQADYLMTLNEDIEIVKELQKIYEKMQELGSMKYWDKEKDN